MSTLILDPRYLDELAFAAYLAREEHVDKSQVSKLLECLEATDSFTLLLFLARQTARGQWTRARPSASAARLYRVLSELVEGVEDEAKRKEILRKALGYFKWFYECYDLDRRALSTYVNRNRNVIENARRNPKAPAPQGFAKEYLRALLGLA